MNHLDTVREIRNTTNCNCTQSLLVAFAAEMGMEAEEAKKMGSFFGGGMLHGSVCGALSGTLMILGKQGVNQKEALDIIKTFRMNHATTDCAVLLSEAVKKGVARKDHCDNLIFEMCQAIDDILSK
ncbi:C-GCAxxG-C-C family protein [Megasphaera paucivorans]|uniref:C_GCAxxG_C_C family probable redox protein n=1 Tax=Megasphaera paucivorans TaxID=349095 RepID=A0A1G9SXD5_9FIRM|nr:C-GCAxxG-C-C family protein [Megasphaera paucivorans]SDM40090.1 C_GCAxxG_C_C family probable redox protein [Megasphaera paucivorans]